MTSWSNTHTNYGDGQVRYQKNYRPKETIPPIVKNNPLYCRICGMGLGISEPDIISNSLISVQQSCLLKELVSIGLRDAIKEPITIDSLEKFLEERIFASVLLSRRKKRKELKNLNHLKKKIFG